jgi:hypothetical protein
VSSQEINHLNHGISARVSSHPNGSDETSHRLEPVELKALRAFLLLLDQWERKEADNGE